MNGNVKVAAIGEDNAMNVFINMLKEGPSMARVDDIQTSKIIIGEEFSGFSIKY